MQFVDYIADLFIVGIHPNSAQAEQPGQSLNA